MEAVVTIVQNYHDTRLIADPKRQIVWKALWDYHFSRVIPKDGCVLDIGCGRGDFINQVVARRRIAIDLWTDFPRFLEPGVETIVGDLGELKQIEDGAVDYALASNIFEHISQHEFSTVLNVMRRKLSPRGTLTILQPNYRYAYKEYFDDYTHVSVYSHISMVDFLTANGYDVMSIIPKFMPLTVKSRMPVFPLLIRAWLSSPIKPLGKQMLITARPRDALLRASA